MMQHSKKKVIYMKDSYFFSQPHQPFFVLAFINAILSMILFMLAFKGTILLTLAPSSFHAYALFFLLFTPAFLAFVFTTYPRFSTTTAIEKSLYLKILGLFTFGSFLFILGALTSSTIYTIGMLITLGAHLWAVKILETINSNSTIEDKHDINWILVAMILGLISHMLFVIGLLFWMPIKSFSIQVAVYLYLFLLAFSIAQRMVPFFSHCMVEKNQNLLKTVAILLTLHVILETIYTHTSFMVDFFLAFIIGKELLRWRLPFPNPNPLLWILHLSLYWIPIAFTFGAISNLISLIDGTFFLVLDIHILVLGFIFTILIGFGTRVTLGHSGNIMVADKWVILLFNLTQVVVLTRLITSMVAAWGWNFMILFDISVTVWLLLFILWAIRFFKTLIFIKK